MKICVKRLYECKEMTDDAKIAELRRWGLPDDTFVHASHCYEEYGCKYGDEDCPVAMGKVKQWYEFDPEWF